MFDLKRFRKENKITQKSLQDLFGVTQPYISAIENQKRPLSKKHYNLLSQTYGDITDKYNQQNSFKEDEAILIEDSYIFTVPRIPVKAYAGFVAEGCCDPQYIDELGKSRFIVKSKPKGRYLSFDVKGDSMDDRSIRSIPEGSEVLCREVKKEYWRDKLHIGKYPYWIIVTNTSIVCKQISAHDTEKGIITCHSISPSPEYSDFDLNLNEVQCLFNIVKISHDPFE